MASLRAAPAGPGLTEYLESNAMSGSSSLPDRSDPNRGVRASLLGHAGAVLWLTGRPGAGKTTLAQALEYRLLQQRVLASVVDGDVLRTGLSHDLGFSTAARHENIRRAGEVALQLAEAGVVVIVALVSPLRAARDSVAVRVRSRGIPFAEVFVNASAATCEQRDPKGLYRRARAGDIPAFTGIDSPYEPPLAPALQINTDNEPVEASLARLAGLAGRLIVPNPRLAAN